MRSALRGLVVAFLLCCFLGQLPAQTANRTNGNGRSQPATADPNGKATVSELRSAIERYTVDRGSLTRSYPVAVSSLRRERFKKFYEEWLATLQGLSFRSHSQ